MQKEVREFQLENLIEDLFSTRTALAQARHDPLTGLPNRAMFEEMLHKACGSALECGSGLALLLVDFDRFKEVNDSLGHAAGDEVLVQGAARLQGCVGDRGSSGAWAGMNLPCCSLNRRKGMYSGRPNAFLRRSVPHFRCKRERPASARPWGRVSFAGGRYPRSPAQDADVACHRAKGEGRDRLWRYRPSTFTDSGYGRVF